MDGKDLIKYIQDRPQLLSGDIRRTIMALLNDRLINPSALIDAQYAIKDEECTRYRLHWQEANVAANILMTGSEHQKMHARMRLMYNSLADTTIPYKNAYAGKLTDKEMQERRKFFELHYGFIPE